MGKKFGNDATASDIDEPPSGAEFIMGSAHWNERLSSARAERENILSKNVTKEGSLPTTSNGKFLSSRSKSGPDISIDRSPGDEIPSIEEILTTANWSDRIAKASARREQIINQRRQNISNSGSQVSGDATEPYKDVVRGAFSGLTNPPITQGESTSDLALTASFSAPIEEEKRRIRPVYFLTLVSVLLFIGLILPGPIRELASNTIDGAVTAFIGPEISSQPRIEQRIIATTTLAPLVAPPAQLSSAYQDYQFLEDDGFTTVTPATFLSRIDQEITLVASTESYSLVSTIGNDSSPVVAVEVSAIAVVQEEFQLDANIGTTVDIAAIGNRSNPTGIAVENAVETQPVAEPLLISTSPLTSSIAPTFLQSPGPELTSAELSGVTILVDLWRPQTNVTLLSRPSISDLIANTPGLIDAIKVPSTVSGFPVAVEPRLSGISLPEVAQTAIRYSGESGLLDPPSIDAVFTTPETYRPPEDNNFALAFSGNYSIHVRAPSSLPEDQLDAFTSALRDTGFDVITPKRVNFTVSKNHVRFFYADDAEAAGMLAAAVDGIVRDFTDYRPSPPAGTIEVWLAGKNLPRSTTRSASRPTTQNPALTNLRNKLLQSLRRGDHL